MKKIIAIAALFLSICACEENRAMNDKYAKIEVYCHKSCASHGMSYENQVSEIGTTIFCKCSMYILRDDNFSSKAEKE